MTQRNEYETIAGAEPNLDEQHEPRTIVRTTWADQSWLDLNQWEPGKVSEEDELVRDELQDYRRGGRKAMMTEIGDGVFVQWSECATCHKAVGVCTCPGGPAEPGYIAQWRIKRLADSFKGRGVEPALPVILKHRDRRVNAVLRLLRSQGWALVPPSEVKNALAAAQEAQDAALSDSNDREIDLLREALESALTLLGKELPEGREEADIIDPDDTSGASDDPDYGGHAEPTAPVECVRHGGPWGGDPTCEHCAYEDGSTRPLNDPGPLGPGEEHNDLEAAEQAVLAARDEKEQFDVGF